MNVREPIRSENWCYRCPVCGCVENARQECPMAEGTEDRPPHPGTMLVKREWVWFDFLDRVAAALDKHRRTHYPGGNVTNATDRVLYEEIEAAIRDHTVEDL